MSESDHGRFLQILSRRHIAFSRALDAWEESGLLERAQHEFERRTEILARGPVEERERVVALTVATLQAALRDRGADDATLDYFGDVLRERWIATIEGRATIDVAGTLRRVDRDLAALILEDKRRAGQLTKRKVRGGIRVTIGTGSLIFDAVKLLFTVPLPGFLATSLWGGAVFLDRGVSDLFLDQ